MAHRKRRKPRKRPPNMDDTGRYILSRFNKCKLIKQIKSRKKFARTANCGYCMVTAVNNAFGECILDTTEVINCAKNLNESNKKDKNGQEVYTYGNEKGFFHFHTIQICLHRKGYKLEEIKSIKHTHTTLSNMAEGRYIAMGWSDPINVHAIAIDCDNSLCICDTQKGYFPLCEYSIIKSLVFGVHRCFKVFKVDPCVLLQ